MFNALSIRSWHSDENEDCNGSSTLWFRFLPADKGGLRWFFERWRAGNSEIVHRHRTRNECCPRFATTSNRPGSTQIAATRDPTCLPFPQISIRSHFHRWSLGNRRNSCLSLLEMGKQAGPWSCLPIQDHGFSPETFKAHIQACMKALEIGVLNSLKCLMIFRRMSIDLI